MLFQKQCLRLATGKSQHGSNQGLGEQPLPPHWDLATANSRVSPCHTSKTIMILDLRCSIFLLRGAFGPTSKIHAKHSQRHSKGFHQRLNISRFRLDVATKGQRHPAPMACAYKATFFNRNMLLKSRSNMTFCCVIAAGAVMKDGSTRPVLFV